MRITSRVNGTHPWMTLTGAGDYGTLRLLIDRVNDYAAINHPAAASA